MPFLYVQCYPVPYFNLCPPCPNQIHAPHTPYVKLYVKLYD